MLTSSAFLEQEYSSLSDERLHWRSLALSPMDLRLISFTTPPDRRALLLEEAKALSTAPAPDSVKKLLDFVGARLSADLSSKTAIQEYYRHEFQNLIDALVKNRKKLRAGYDPKSPSDYRHLLEWYRASVDKLAPLMVRIKATDRLIDQIVYRLYGLTGDEIKIVEESVNATGVKEDLQES